MDASGWTTTSGLSKTLGVAAGCLLNSAVRRLTQSFPYYLFVNALARAAPDQLAVNHHGGKAADAKLGGTICYLVLVHVMYP